VLNVKNIRLVTLSFLLSSLLFSQEQGNTVAVLVFEGRGISLSESTTLSDRFRTALADIGYVRIVEQKMVTDVLVNRVFSRQGVPQMNVPLKWVHFWAFST